MPQSQQETEVAARADRARKVIAAHLRRCGDAGALDRDQLIRAHPELKPELEREIRKLRLIERARIQSESEDGTLEESGSIPPPDSFPGYDVICQIHRGGQGVVYKALEKGSNRKVAIKVMRDGPFAGPHDRSRFLREVQVLGALKHPNIVTVHDSGSTAGHSYFVMEYISGQPLDLYMAGAERSIEFTLKLFGKICDAVNAAHLRGVIHRDLKSSNIRVSASSEPYVLDFGLAKIESGSDEGASTPTMTVTGQFVGSLPWAAPEQVEGSPDRIDLRTDVYALGVVLFQMLTGKFPYNVVGTFREVTDNIVHAEPARPSAVQPRVNDEIDTIVAKCLSKEPERRYQSAGDLARDCRRYLRGEPIDAKRDSSWYVFRKTASRYRVPMAVATAFVLVVIGFGAAMFVLYGRANQEAATAHRVQAVLESMFTELGPSESAGQLTVRGILDQSADRVAEQLALEPRAQVQLMETIANRYAHIGVYDSAAAWMERALRIRRSVLRDVDEIIAVKLTALGSAHWNAGAEDKTEATIKEALMLYRNSLGRASGDAIEALLVLARLYHEQGQFEDAGRLYREALDTCRKLHTEPHADTAHVLTRFGSFLGNAGDHREARRLLEEALAISRTLYAGDHRQLAARMMRLGGELQDSGQYEAALPYVEDGLAMQQRLFPHDEIFVVRGLQTLGLLRKDLGDYEIAETLIQTAIETELRVTGGRENKTVAQSYNSLAKVYSDAGDWERAETPCRESLRIYLELLPRDHMVVSRPMTLLGRILVHQERFTEAEPLLREALAIRRARRGFPGDWKTAKTESILGACLTGLKRYEEAEPLLLHSYPIIARDRGPHHRRTAEALQRLVDLFDGWGKPEQAAEYRAILQAGTQ